MTKKVAISGYYGFKNFGDELILSILTNKLKKEKTDITVFSVNPEFTIQEYGVNAVKTFNPFQILKTLWETDVLISGGGSLFQDATSIKSVLYYAFVLGIAQFFGKKTIIFAQGVGPLYHSLSRFLVKKLFANCNYISVRDEKSQNILNSWGIKSDLVPDPAYSLNLTQHTRTETLGIQVREFPKFNDNFLDKLIAEIKNSPYKTIKVFSLQKSLDLEVCKKLTTELLKKLSPEKNIELIEENIIEELCHVDTLISMRFHALIVALKAGAKCAVINYDPKVQILAEKYSLPIIEFNNTEEEIATAIKNAKSATIKENAFPWKKILEFIS